MMSPVEKSNIMPSDGQLR